MPCARSCGVMLVAWAQKLESVLRHSQLSVVPFRHGFSLNLPCQANERRACCLQQRPSSRPEAPFQRSAVNRLCGAALRFAGALRRAVGSARVCRRGLTRWRKRPRSRETTKARTMRSPGHRFRAAPLRGASGSLGSALAVLWARWPVGAGGRTSGPQKVQPRAHALSNDWSVVDG